jgi:DNA-directed RNA polymerase
MNKPNEIEHENRLIDRGRKELIKELEKWEQRNYYSTTDAGRWSIEDAYARFKEALIKETEIHLTKATGSTTIIWRLCREMKTLIEYLGADVISVYALKAIFDHYSRADATAIAVQVANAIGSRIESEVQMKWIQENTDSEIASAARRSASMPGSTPKYRLKRTKHLAKKKASAKGYELADAWTPTFKNSVGMYLMDIATCVGLIKWDLLYERNKQKSIIYADDLVRQFNSYEDQLIAAAYKSFPLVDTPLNWISEDKPARLNTSGGYHLPQLRKLNAMCRSFASNSLFGAKAIDLLNTLQQTSWRVDQRILEIAEHLERQRISIGSFETIEIERPDKGNAPPHVLEDPERMKQWRQEKAELHRRYLELKNKTYRSRQAVSLAKEYKFKTFFLSWSLDWRGRFYAQQSWLSLESTDFERSLLKFRDGCKLSNDSLFWCKAAIGAAFNGTGDSFNTRIKWTEDNQELIKSIADDPISTRHEWSAAKNPWQFLQLCVEWSDVVITQKEKFWKVPIGVDSTASGFQLLSAMRRDPIGMKYANLLEPETEDEPPQDAYIKVLDAAKELAKDDPEFDSVIPYLKHRSVGKGALMLAIYGGSASGIRDKIRENLEGDQIQIEWDDLKKLQTLVSRAAKKVFPAAFQALEWLKKLARAHHAQGATSITWTTPTGDSIHCIKHAIETETIATTYNGKVVIADWNSREPDLKKQVSSFVPAFVHCFDAALLKEAFSDWQHPIASIHDCVRVLPADMDRAMDRIRDGFVSIVDGDPLAKLADDLGVSDCELKRLPQLDQDLTAVQQSRYMFN